MRQTKPIPCFFGDPQVPVVNRVKSATKNADLLHGLGDIPVALADLLAIATLLPDPVGIQPDQDTGDQQLQSKGLQLQQAHGDKRGENQQDPLTDLAIEKLPHPRKQKRENCMDGRIYLTPKLNLDLRRGNRLGSHCARLLRLPRPRVYLCDLANRSTRISNPMGKEFLRRQGKALRLGLSQRSCFQAQARLGQICPTVRTEGKLSVLQRNRCLAGSALLWRSIFLLFCRRDHRLQDGWHRTRARRGTVCSPPCVLEQCSLPYRLSRMLRLPQLLLIRFELWRKRDAYCFDFRLLRPKRQPRAYRVFVRHLSDYLSLNYSTCDTCTSGRYVTLVSIRRLFLGLRCA